MSESTELATTKSEHTSIIDHPAKRLNATSLAFITDTDAFNHLWRVATGYAKSSMVPQQFRAKIEDCFIACQLALRLNVDPFMLMQSTYIVHGKPGFEAKLAIALLNASGKIKGTVKTVFDGTGDGYGCTAWAIDAATGEKVIGPKVDMRMVKAEGWDRKDGSKWKTMPGVMFVYRAATFLIRTNYPEVLMGMPTVDEVEDVGPTGGIGGPDLSNQARLELLLAGAPDKPAETPKPEPPIDATSEPVDPPANTQPEAKPETDLEVMQGYWDALSITETPEDLATLASTAAEDERFTDPANRTAVVAKIQAKAKGTAKPKRRGNLID